MIVNELTFAKLDEVAYDDPQDFGGTVIDDFDDYKAFQTTGSESVLVQKGDVCILACRGTESTSWFDIITDIRALLPRKSHFGRVHRGFDDYAHRIRKKVLLELKARQPREIWLTGHSLGAAAATVFAGDLFASGWKNVGLVTVGSPSALTDSGARAIRTMLGDRSHRFVLGADIVTRSPLPHMAFPYEAYRHVKKKPHYIASDKKIYENCDRSFIVADVGRKLAGDVGAAFSDHSSKGYRQAMEKHLLFREDNGLDSIISIEC